MKKILLLLLLVNFGFGQSKKDTLTVYFESNEFKISPENEAVLSSFFSNKEITITSVAIEGFCDDIGKENANDKLATNRAKIVADYLENNFAILATTVTGKGEVALDDVTNPEKYRKTNRKATLVVEYQNKIKKSSVKSSPSVYKTFDDFLKTGDKIIIQNLIFNGSSTVFEDPEEAEASLQKVVNYLKSNPNMEIEIQGHVCCISKSFKDARDAKSGKNNLSETRAKRVFDYFIDNGIVPERLTYKGYGRMFPIVNGEEMKNKRVEILVKKI
jgi:outer membrane protein OmpA-like peptidoglycan-associated protein